MNTLAKQFKAALARVAKGEAVQPAGLASLDNRRNKPPAVDAASLLRASFQAMVKKAQTHFISGIAANLYTSEVMQVCSYIPQTEACYSMLYNAFFRSGIGNQDGDPDRLQLTGATPASQKILDDTWNPFLRWVKEQGLHLHVSREGEAYGVRDFLILEVYVPEGENIETEAIALA